MRMRVLSLWLIPRAVDHLGLSTRVPPGLPLAAATLRGRGLAVAAALVEVEVEAVDLPPAVVHRVQVEARAVHGEASPAPILRCCHCCGAGESVVIAIFLRSSVWSLEFPLPCRLPREPLVLAALLHDYAMVMGMVTVCRIRMTLLVWRTSLAVRTVRRWSSSGSPW
jgi:hypothetical protein